MSASVFARLVGAELAGTQAGKHVASRRGLRRSAFFSAQAPVKSQPESIPSTADRAAIAHGAGDVNGAMADCHVADGGDRADSQGTVELDGQAARRDVLHGALDMLRRTGRIIRREAHVDALALSPGVSAFALNGLHGATGRGCLACGIGTPVALVDDPGSRRLTVIERNRFVRHDVPPGTTLTRRPPPHRPSGSGTWHDEGRIGPGRGRFRVAGCAFRWAGKRRGRRPRQVTCPVAARRRAPGLPFGEPTIHVISHGF